MSRSFKLSLLIFVKSSRNRNNNRDARNSTGIVSHFLRQSRSGTGYLSIHRSRGDLHYSQHTAPQRNRQ